MLTVRRFRQEDKDWCDTFVGSSKNGTFLFRRDYTNYHRDLFDDHSLIVSDGNTSLALLPANEADGVLHSHQGLTYGGLVVDGRMTCPLMIDVLEAVLEYSRAQRWSAIIYKSVPFIYHRQPAGEDLFALHRAGASLIRRDPLSVVEIAARLPYQERRKPGMRKAQRLGLEVRESRDWDQFWPVLEAVLEERHGAAPVHNLSEISMISRLFPKEVRLFVAKKDAEILAGTVIYESEMVAHTQYIAATKNGRDAGALDLLFDQLLGEICADKRYFDFGASTEDEGRTLNNGLIQHKAGFGARTVVHDSYRIDLDGAAVL